MKFEDLNLAPPLMQALNDVGYTIPTPIQHKAIPEIMVGKDLLGLAQTGTGKTAAFALPILHELITTPPPGNATYRPLGARALVLSPTRELAQQVHESFVKYGKYANQRCVVIFGGVHQYDQVQKLKAGYDVLIATPGRLLDLMGQRYVRLSLVEIAVLDEADRMLDIGFLPAIRKILAHVPEDRQALLFSATMPPEINALAKEFLKNPVRVEASPTEMAAVTVTHWVHFVTASSKVAMLARILREAGTDRTLVFTKTKRGADILVRKLRDFKIRASAMHGDKDQAHRTRVLGDFKSARSPVLVATDVAARGLHIDEVARVVNYDLPHEPETYVHRIGRTGRAGAEGTAISLCTSAERRELLAIEKLIRQPLQRAEGTPDSDPSLDPALHAGPARAAGASRRSGGRRPRGGGARRKRPAH